jgi:hypothetical protein
MLQPLATAQQAAVCALAAGIVWGWWPVGLPSSRATFTPFNCLIHGS